MKRILQGLPVLALLLVALLIIPAGWLHAEKVADLPKPVGYVSDFAGVLSAATQQNLESLCTQVDRQAHSQIAVVTIKTLDDDQSIEEFTTQLEEKWKVGKKGTDQGLLMVVVLNPKKYRIEVGYGLEGILNDAKVGDIGRAMVPYLSTGDYNSGIQLGVQRIAQVIAADAGVTLAQPEQHYYHREPAQQQAIHLSFFQVVIAGAVILFILIVLVKTGNVGLIFFLLGNLMGGGGGGRRGGGDGDGGGGGFGGFGGGSSGGGGASGDY